MIYIYFLFDFLPFHMFLKLSLGLNFATFSFEYFHFMVYPMSYTPRFRIFCHLILFEVFYLFQTFFSHLFFLKEK